jgi:guanosine-3',5'-bis(diphosphate) 3'-pyrophosphohydrolase
MYKTGKDRSEQLSGSHRRAREWVQSLLEMQERTGNSLEFIENVKIDLFPDEVYVFTPKGAIMELPQGSTPVDFAYAVHTDVGARCVAARINRRLAPLSEPLQSGQTVEVITSPNAQPNPAWLNFVVTGKARSNIRHFLKHQRHSESIELGQRLLNKALHSLGSSIESLSEAQINALLKTTGHRNFDYILEDIGLGNRAAFVTARQLVPEQQGATTAGAAKPPRARAPDAVEPVPAEQIASEQIPLVINGSEGSMVTFARCCHPIPGDPIIGHISAGRGIVVHADACNNLQDVRANRAKNIPLVWADSIEGEFLVELRVELEQTRGIVATLASKIHGFDANIEKISVEEKDARYTVVQLEIGVQNRVHLARIMRRIRTIKSVQRVYRVKNARARTTSPTKRKITP